MNNAGKFVFRPTAQSNRPVNAIRPIKEYLDEQSLILDRLEKVISSEYQALKGKNMDDLKTYSELKSDLMLKLQSNDQRIKLHPEVDKLKTEYLTDTTIIKNKLLKCKFRNEVNGKLIVFNMQSNNRLNAALMNARDARTRNMTYSGKGYASARGPSRLSVQA